MDPLTGAVRHIDSVGKSGSCLKQNTGGLNLSGHHLQKQGERRNPDRERQGDSCPCEDLCCLSSPCIALRPQDSESGNINAGPRCLHCLSSRTGDLVSFVRFGSEPPDSLPAAEQRAAGPALQGTTR